MSRLVVSGLRGRLLLAVAVVVTAALAAIVVGFNLVLSQQLSADVDSVLRARSSAELASLSTAKGRLAVIEAPDDAALDSQVWVFAGRRVLERPRTTSLLNRAAAALATGPVRTVGVRGAQTRLHAVPITSGGQRLGTVVTGASVAPYERTQRIALIGSLILAALLLTGVLIIARWLLAIALKPVAQMTAEAADWSEHHLDRRFGLGPPHDELTQLAATLDDLLSRLAASIRHEQRFSAELSHELRTPLARIRAEAELALRPKRTIEEHRQALQAVLESAERMSRVIETLVAVARQEANHERETADAGEIAARAVEACEPLASKRGIDLKLEPSSTPLCIDADGDLVERILTPVIENACCYGKSKVRVQFVREGAAVLYSVADDGSGILATEQEQIFEPGKRGAAAQANGVAVPGAGLGLALARRLSRAVGGEVEVRRPAGPGGLFLIRLPSV